MELFQIVLDDLRGSKKFAILEDYTLSKVKVPAIFRCFSQHSRWHSVSRLIQFSEAFTIQKCFEIQMLLVFIHNKFHRVRRSSELHWDVFDRWDLCQTVAKHTIYVVVLEIADLNLHDIKKKKTISFSNFPGTFATFKAVVLLNVAKYFAARSSWWEKFNIYFSDTKRHKDLICGNSTLMGFWLYRRWSCKHFLLTSKAEFIFLFFSFPPFRSGIE